MSWDSPVTGFTAHPAAAPAAADQKVLIEEFSGSDEFEVEVNTVVFADGKRHVHNTDYWGFAEGFRRALSDAPKDRVLLLGAGGAGGAVANALLDNGVHHLVLRDVNAAAASRLAGSLAARLGADQVEIIYRRTRAEMPAFGEEVDDDGTISAHLEDGRRDVEVLNFGVPGYNLDQEIEALRSKALAFAPEAFTRFYQRSLYQSMRTLTEKAFALLRRRLSTLPEELEEDAERLAALARRHRAHLLRLRTDAPVGPALAQGLRPRVNHKAHSGGLR